MAIITIDYCVLPNINRVVFYNDSTHTVEVSDLALQPSVCELPIVDGSVIHEDRQRDSRGVEIGVYKVFARADLMDYFGNVLYFPTAPLRCDAAIIGSIITPESLPGSADGQIQLTSSPSSGLEYKLGTGAYQASNIFLGLTSGSYLFTARRLDSLCEGRPRNIALTANSQLSGSFTKSDVTATGLSDGSIDVSVVGGSGNYSFLWNDTVITRNRVSLLTGLYSLTITDITTGVTFDLSNIPIDEPAIVEDVLGSILRIPQVNSLRFVDNSIIDQCDNPQNADNSFLSEQGDSLMKRDYYAQKVNKCDVLTIQVQSDFVDIVPQLIRCIDDSVAKTFSIEKTVTIVGNTSTLDIRIINNGGITSRVYFTASQAIPFLLEVGDPFEVVNNSDGFNSVYEVVDILNDDLLGSQYLVINKIYDIAASSTLGRGVFKDQALDFDIFTIRADFSGLADGDYYMKVSGFNGLSEDAVTKSEPISLSDNHNATVEIRFTNIDNAFDINYQTNINHKVRVSGRMFKAVPSSNQTSIRDTNGSVTKLSSKPQRKYNLEFNNIPPYLHELLSLAFNHDFVFINDVQFGSEEGLQEPSYFDGYNLASSSIIVEQTEWFKTYNGDDLGGIDNESGFIDSGNNGLIALN